MSRRFVYVLALAAACGGGGSSASDAPPITFLDAAPDGPPMFSIDVRLRGSAALAVYRDGSGAWQPLDMTGSNTAVMHVLGDYELVSVCTGSGAANGSGSAGAFTATEIAAVPDDGQQVVSCGARRIGGGGGGGGSGSGSAHALSGTLAEVGTVYLGSAAQPGSAAPWAWSFEVGTGTFTVVGVAGDHVLLREGLAVAGSDVAVTPALDTALEGSAFVHAALAAANAQAGAPVAATTQLRTQSGVVTFPVTSGSDAQYVDASLLSSHDSQTIEVEVTTAACDQVGEAALVGAAAPPAFTLIPPLDVQYTVGASGVLAAAWGTTTANGNITLSVASPTGQQRQAVSASAGWRAIHTAPALAFDTTATGYDPSWIVDAAQPVTATLTAAGSDASATYVTTMTDTAGSAAAR